MGGYIRILLQEIQSIEKKYIGETRFVGEGHKDPQNAMNRSQKIRGSIMEQMQLTPGTPKHKLAIDPTKYPLY